MAETDIGLASLTKEINRMIKGNESNNRKSIELLGKMYKSEIDKMIKSS